MNGDSSRRAIRSAHDKMPLLSDASQQTREALDGGALYPQLMDAAS